jgi:hypothetical protein
MVVSNSSDSRCDSTATPWSPIVPDSSTTSPGRALRAADVAPGGQHADAGGADEDAVALALFHDLGVAGDDGHAGLARGGGHRLDDALQVGQRQPFLEDEAGRQVQRHRAHHRHVVDRAVHREAADVAAGKNSGEITCASVAITSRWPAGSVSTRRRCPGAAPGCRRRARTAPRSAAPTTRPPAPWFMSMRPCLKSSGRM